MSSKDRAETKGRTDRQMETTALPSSLERLVVMNGSTISVKIQLGNKEADLCFAALRTCDAKCRFKFLANEKLCPQTSH